MILDWLIYALAVSALVTAAALAAERAAREQGWPARWVWTASLAASIALPAAAVVLPARGPIAPLPAFPVVYALPALVPIRAAGEASPGPTLGTLLLAAWVAATAVLLGVLAVAAVRLGRSRRRWQQRRVDGVDVLVSATVGPAAVGIWRGAVVLPGWALELDAERRRLLVRHEAEHVRAGDPRLALAALLACALVPWNPAMWWQLRRLRLALEMDCDARVLRHGGDARRYGSLLLEVGQRRAVLALGLAEGTSMLERRIRMITRTTSGRRRLHGLGLAASSALALALALSCEAPKDRPVGAQGAAADAVSPTEPTVVPDRALPSKVSAADFSDFRALFAHAYTEEYQKGRPGDAYKLLADAGPLAKTDDDRLTRAFWMAYILYEQAQEIAKPMTAESAAQAEPLFQGARELFESARAYQDLHPSADVPKLLQATGKYLEIQEALLARGPDGAGATPEASKAEAAAKMARAYANGPTFTPMTTRPELKNGKDVQQALMTSYPPLLRNAGIGGTTNVWFFIDENGRVAKTMINKSSGYDALDQAALNVAGTMEFTPGMNGEKKVPVWVALDIRFAVE